MDRIQKRFFSGPACPAPQVTAVQPVYSLAPAWNDYIRNDGPTAYEASNTACSGTEFGGYNACLHGGELRKTTVTNRNDCSGLRAADSLGVFNWRCVVVSGAVQMASGGLADGHYTSELIDFANGSWRALSVSVADACGTGETAPAVWYNNPIVLNTTGVSPLNLASPGTLYAFSVNPARRFVLGADRVGLVVKPGIKLTGDASAATVIGANTRNFLWIEGTIDATNDEIGIQFDAVRFSVLRGVGVHGAFGGVTNTGIRLITNSDNNLLYDVMTANQSQNMTIAGSGNQFRQVRSFDARTLTGIGLGTPSRNNILTGIVAASSNEWGFAIFQTNNSVAMNVSAVNNASGTDGVRLRFAVANTLMNVLSINSSNAGLSLNNDSDRNTLANAALMHNATTELVYISTDNDNNYFTGTWKMAAANCTFLGGAGAGLDATCSPSGSSDFSLSIASAAGSMVGGVTSDDSSNTSDVAGSAAYSDTLDWTRFENFYRGWGRTGSGFPSAANMDSCLGGTCYIWDFSLRAPDTILRNILPLPTGNDTLVHIWSTPGGLGDCNNIRGAVWQAQVCSYPGYATSGTCIAAGGVWSTSLCSTRFLRNAVELFSDGFGNDNGLCESNEVCLFTPNIGAYQGHGQLVSAGAFSDGMLSGISLVRYADNGR